MKIKKQIIDDGFNSELVKGARFDGIFEIPHIPGPKKLIIPNGMIPFTKINYSKTYNEFIVFYEHDIKFRDILTSTYEHINKFRDFPGIVSPDCSLYKIYSFQNHLPFQV